MRNTEVVTVRVGDGFKQRFADFCDKAGMTQREAIENMVEDYFNGGFAIDGGHIVQKIVFVEREDEEIPFNEEPDYTEYTEFGFDNLVRLLRKKEYPDEYIKKMVDTMMGTAYEMPKFNPRRMRDNDCGC